VSSPYTGVSTYVEDPAGNVTSRTDANGATTTMVYDALNRRTSAVSTRSGYTTETCSWAYDSTTAGNYGIGRLASVTDPTGSTTYTYERRGLRASQVQTVGSTQYTTSYKYDGNGNRITQTLPSARVLTYTFDYADRPQSVASTTATYVSATSYEPFGPVTQLQFGNGTTQTWTYSTRYLPSENKLTHGATTLADFVYTNNAAGFVGSIADAVSSGYSRTFAYGGRAGNMLTGATTGASLWGSATFADAYNQNLSSVRIPGSDYGLGYNRAQQLTSIFNTDSGSSQTVTHDAAGNETAVGTSTYTYSVRNHLAGGDGVSYTYDGYGYRVSATSSSGTRTSIYDAARHLESETSLTSGSVAYEYIWLGDIPVAQEDTGGQTHWTATDHLHAPFLQTSSIGAVYWQADYSPLGSVYSLRTADAHQPLRMAGQEAEEFVVGNPNGATPRYYNGLRWYRTSIGRYTQADPLDYDGGAYNLYAYANNNGENFEDPLGLGCGGIPSWLVPLGIAIGVGALAFAALASPEFLVGAVLGEVAAYALESAGAWAIAQVAAVLSGLALAGVPGAASLSSNFVNVISGIGNGATSSLESTGAATAESLADGAGAEDEALAGAGGPAGGGPPGGGPPAPSFFDGTRYSTKVQWQASMGGPGGKFGPGEFHGFPESVTAFENFGTTSSLTGGSGATYQMLSIPGSYLSSEGDWYEGEFQFIKDSTGLINHRFFAGTPASGP
jgi:RHS repeat-associated protein